MARRYRSAGWRVVAVGRGAGSSAAADARHVWDLPHRDFGALVATERPDLCVNAAGRSSVPASMEAPLADFEASTSLNYQVLDDLRRLSPRAAFIHLSSAAVYGEPARLPVSEADPPSPISAYGWHRRLSELVAESHARLFGLRTASVRIFSAFGAGLRRQVVWDLARRAQAGAGPLALRGRADDSRDFIHGADVAEAVAAVAERGDLAGECYNVASGRETPIAELAELILRQLGRAPDLSFDAAPQPGVPHRWRADVSRLAALGFAPSVSLEAGVAEVVREAAGA